MEKMVYDQQQIQRGESPDPSENPQTSHTVSGDERGSSRASDVEAS
jgi:hypothetical protein